MDTLSIETTGGKINFVPGEVITGAAKWQLSDNPDELTITLFWYTDGKGTQDIGIVESMTISMPGQFGDKDFSFKLPNGPYSFSGKLISLKWALELSDNKGKRVAQKEITVSPTGSEIVLSGPQLNRTGVVCAS